MAGLLGNGPSRQFKIFRTEKPALFRFNGELYVETPIGWKIASLEEATRLTQAQLPKEN